MISDRELMEMGRAALEERNRLLATSPELRGFQMEIDRRLNMAGNHEARMAVLVVMIEAKLMELRDNLSCLYFLNQQVEAGVFYLQHFIINNKADALSSINPSDFHLTPRFKIDLSCRIQVAPPFSPDIS